MNLLIVGNSVSLKTDEGAETYPQILKQNFDGVVNVVEIIRGGYTVRDLETAVLDALQKHSPSLMVLQVGHVDCAPRPLKKWERNKLSKLSPQWLREKIIQFVHDHRARIIRLRGLIQFAPSSVFEKSVRAIVSSAGSRGCLIFVLPVTRVSIQQEEREPWYNREIERYNSILRKFCSDQVVFIEQEKILGDLHPEEYCLTPEDLHLKGFAHKMVADYLEMEIRKKLVK